MVAAPRSRNQVDGLVTGISRLAKAWVRGERAAFREPPLDVISKTTELLLTFAEQWSTEMLDVSITIGPDGSVSVVMPFGAKEADITVPANGGDCHVSVYDYRTGVAAEKLCETARMVRQFVVRSL